MEKGWLPGDKAALFRARMVGGPTNWGDFVNSYLSADSVVATKSLPIFIALSVIMVLNNSLYVPLSYCGLSASFEATECFISIFPVVDNYLKADFLKKL